VVARRGRGKKRVGTGSLEPTFPPTIDKNLNESSGQRDKKKKKKIKGVNLKVRGGGGTNKAEKSEPEKTQGGRWKRSEPQDRNFGTCLRGREVREIVGSKEKRGRKGP